MSSFRASEVTIKRSRGLVRIPVAIGVASGLFALLCFAWQPLADYLPYAAGLVMIECVLICFFPLFMPEGGSRLGEERVTLLADATGVFANDKRVLARGDIASAAVERQVNGLWRVFLIGKRTSNNFEAVFGDLDRARKFLEVLSLKADQSTATFHVLRELLDTQAAKFASKLTWIASALLLLGAVFAAMRRLDSDLVLLSYPPLLLALSFVRKWFRAKAQVVVGADRVVVRVGRRVRSIPYRAIRSVTRDGDGVELVLEGGQIVPLYFAIGGDADMQPAALAKRIEEGIRAHGGQDADEGFSGRLLRAGRPIAEWLLELREIGSPQKGGYRIAPVPEDVLWRLVEMPSADPSARAGAAVALGPSLSEEGRTRLRVAAAATALPGVRAVLLAAASSGDDDEIASALERHDDVS